LPTAFPRVDLRKILRSSGGQFGRDQIGTANKERPKAACRVDHAFDPAIPCCIEVDAGDVEKNIEAVRVSSETKNCRAP
jgi:hypothetical protein